MRVIDYHITPMAQGGSYDDPDNLQALCKECHDRKTVDERLIIKERKKNV